MRARFPQRNTMADSEAGEQQDFVRGPIPMPEYARKKRMAPPEFGPQTDTTSMRQGQPLSNEASATSVQQNPQPELADVYSGLFINPKLPPESDGRGSEAANENMQPLSAIEQRLLNISEQLKDSAYRQPTRVTPSLGRKILGNVAGFGLGALTMNPYVGMGVRQSILDQPTMQAREEAMVRSQPLTQEFERLSGISGLSTKRLNEEAQMAGAQASMASAKAAQFGHEVAQAKNKYEEENPEMAYEKTGNETLTAVPKRAPSTGSAVSQAKSIGGPKPIQKDYVRSVGANGVLRMVNNKDPNDVVMPKDENGKPIVEGTDKAQAFDRYWNALKPNERTAEAAMKWQVAGASNASSIKDQREVMTDDLLRSAKDYVRKHYSDKMLNDPNEAAKLIDSAIDTILKAYPDYKPVAGAARDKSRSRLRPITKQTTIQQYLEMLDSQQ